ncbi:MAG: hypothetical protein AAF585_08805 [Verrucomicrobiota bacterium]
MKPIWLLFLLFTLGACQQKPRPAAYGAMEQQLLTLREAKKLFSDWRIGRQLPRRKKYKVAAAYISEDFSETPIDGPPYEYDCIYVDLNSGRYCLVFPRSIAFSMQIVAAIGTIERSDDGLQIREPDLVVLQWFEVGRTFIL